MTHKTQPTAHAEITAPISADLRRIDAQERKYWERLCALPKFSFILSAAGGVARAQDSCGNWVEASAVQQIVDDAESRIAELEALQAAPPAPAAVAVPDGFALVPKRLTRAMERVLLADEEGWQWEDLLAAAEAITEEEYAALAAAPAQAKVSQDHFAPAQEHATQGRERDKPLIVRLAEDFAEDCVNARYVTTGAPSHARLMEHATQLAGGAVAYLDLGAGGYLDIGTDLSDEQLSKLPKGRHMLVIGGTYGVDGYAAAPGEMQKESDAAQLLKKYRKLCLEIGRGDSYHIARIDAAIAAAPAQAQEDARDAELFRAMANAAITEDAAFGECLERLGGDCKTIDDIRAVFDAARAAQGGA